MAEDVKEEDEFLEPLKKGWLEKLDLATQRKKPYQETADQCMAFYAGGMGWMWEDRFRNKFLGADINLKFKICICKAFELVALYGPSLYYRNPTRCCQPHPRPKITAEIMAAGAGIDWQEAQETQQQFQQMQQAGQMPPLDMQMRVFQFQQMQQQFSEMERKDRIEQTQRKALADITETYLSYTPREQPNGGLMQASQDAVTDALVKGRGILMPEPYRMPGSNRKLTGCFLKSVEDLLIDPDALSTGFGDAKWMSLDAIEPTWQVERRYGHKPGSLKGNLESGEAQAARRAHPLGNLEHERGTTFDLLRYTRIWSIGGVGTRLTGTDKKMQRAFDDVVGDYAHVVVAKGVPGLLNAPTARFKRADDAWVREAFGWPVPYWMDRRWPFAFLDFFRKPRSPWPIPPIAPGLGELTALNVLISMIVQRGWDSARRIRAVAKSALEEVEKKLKSTDMDVTIVLKNIQGDISQVIHEFEQNDLSIDTWRVVERLFELFDKRVGLTDGFYGGNPGGSASRTATDAKVKDERISVRPDHMAQQVESWQTEAAQMEKQCAYANGISGDDVRPFMGTAGALLWDQLFASADPETIVREVDCTVEAQSVRKPNKERETSNMNQVFPAMAQELSKHADVTTDTEPLNALYSKFGDAIEQDMSDLKMGPRVPPPPPPDEAAQMEAELEQAKMQAELQLKQMDMQAKQLEQAGKQDEMQAQSQVRQVDLFQDQQSHGQEMVQDEQVHDQELRQRAETHAQEMEIQEAKARVDRATAQAKAKQQANQQAKQTVKPKNKG